MDRLLDVGDADHVQLQPARVAREDVRQLLYLFARLAVGVGIAVEVQRLDGHAALGDHVAGHGAVDAAGEQQHPLARCADGHAARRLDPAAEHQRVAVFAHVDADEVLRGVHVYAQSGARFQQPSAHFGVDLHGIEGEVLVGAVCLHLKAPRLGRDRKDGRKDVVQRRGHLIGDAERVGAEHLLQARNDLVRARLVEIFHHIAAARLSDLVADAGERFFQVVHEHLFKVAAVFALQMYLAIADDDDLFHITLSSLSAARRSG